MVLTSTPRSVNSDIKSYSTLLTFFRKYVPIDSVKDISYAWKGQDFTSLSSTETATLCSKFISFISALVPDETCEDSESVPEALISILTNESLSVELKDLLAKMNLELTALKSDIVYGECDAISQLDEDLKVSGLYEFSLETKDSVSNLISQIRPIIVSLEENRQAIGSLLEQRRELHSKMAQSQLSEEILDSLKQLEDIQASFNETASKNDQKLTADQINFLERMAVVYNQVIYLVGRIDALPLATDSRVNRVKDRFIEFLEAALVSALEKIESSNVAADAEGLEVTRILKVFALIDKIELSYGIFASKVVQPKIKALIPKEKSEEHIKSFFDSVLTWISSPICLSVRNSGFEVGQSVSFLAHSIIPCILEDIIASQMSYIYSPGIPNIFLRNYRLSEKFLLELEQDVCRNEIEREFLRESPVMEEYRTRKWNINIYFQIRYKDLISEFEEVLSIPMAVPTFESYKGAEVERTLLTGTIRMLRMLSFCWSEKCFLPSLGPKFWKLTMLLLFRYSKWLHKLATDDANKKKVSDVTLGKPGSKSMDENNAANDVHSECRKIVSFYHNTRYSYEEANKVFDKEIVPSLLQGANSDQIQVLRDAMNESMSLLVNEVKPFLISKIHSLFNGICMESLKDSKLVPGLYRRTQRTVSTHSAYVETCLTSWDEFLDRSEPVFGKGLEGLSMSIKFYEGLIKAFKVLLEEILDGIKKTEESLKRFNRRAATVNKSSQSDEDRIRRQFQLDAEFLKQKITNNLQTRYNSQLSLNLNSEFDQLMQSVASTVTSFE